MENKTFAILFGLANLLVTSSLSISLYTLSQYKLVSIPKIDKENMNLYQLTQIWNISHPQQQAQQQTAPQTDIASRIGVVATSVGYKNMAIVYVDGERKIVREGDSVKGVKVLRISKDYVEFLAGGQKNKVKLGYIPQPQTQTQPSIPVQNLPPLENVLPPHSRGTNTIPKSELERLTSDPGIMFTQIRLIPFVEDGRTRGFRFDWIAEGSLFQRMGINVGDILVSINNQPINSGEDAFRILQIIRNERSFKIAILRNGQPVELTYMVN